MIFPVNIVQYISRYTDPIQTRILLNDARVIKVEPNEKLPARATITYDEPDGSGESPCYYATTESVEDIEALIHYGKE